ncbi:MAG: hypothetical protein AAB415_01980 [Patescibacteria group bacterium]
MKEKETVAKKFVGWIKDAWPFILVLFVFYILVALAFFKLRGIKIPMPTGLANFPFSLGEIWLAMVTVYTVAGIRTNLVGESEIGSKIILGRPTYNVKAGLIFVPPFISRIKALPGVKIRVVIGTRQTIKNDKGEIIYEEKTGPEGAAGSIMLRLDNPFRVNFAHPTQADYGEYGKVNKGLIEKLKKENPLEQQLTTDPVLLFIWRINNATQYIKAIGDRESIQDASRQMGEVGQGCLSTYCAQRTPAYVSFFQEEAERVIRKKVEKLIGEKIDGEETTPKDSIDQDDKVPWGIALDEVSIQTLGLPYDVNKAIALARAAGFNQQARTTDAESRKRELIAEGQGRGDAKAYEMTSEAYGIYVLALTIDQNPSAREALRLENISKTFGPTTTTVLVDSQNPTGNLLGPAMVVAKNIGNDPKK